MRKSLISALAIILIVSSALAQDKRPLTAEDYYVVKNVGSPSLSPDGKYVAFTVQTVREKENDRRTRIWMKDLESGEVYPFTSPEHSSTNPRWSEDGEYLIFKPAPGNLSPDGSYRLFTKRVGMKPEQPRQERQKDDDFDGIIIEHRAYKRDGRSNFIPTPQPDRGGITQIFRVNVGDTPDTLQLTAAGLAKGSPTWSQDGQFVLYTESPLQRDENDRPLEFLERKFGNTAYTISVDGGEPEKMDIRKGQLGSFSFANNSNRFYYSYTPERFKESEYYVYELDTDKSVRLDEDWIYGIRGVRWSPDDRWLYFTASIGGSSHLCRIQSDGTGKVEQITHGDFRYGSFQYDEDMTYMVYTKTSPTMPGELFMADIDGSNERQLTHIKQKFLDEVYLSPVKRLEIEGRGGLNIEGWLMEPYGYEPGKKYPLVLQIHGGPHSAYGNTYFQQFQMLAAQGFYVLYTNPRGSSGYGHDFTYVTREKWGIDDYDDLMRFVDYAIENFDVDEKKLGVAGGSYGGFMTNWIISQTDRFAAAATSRSICNWFSFFGNSDIQSLVVNEFGFGYPWDKKVADNMWKLSPIAHVRNVKTPTLIIHSEQDYRCPIGQGEEWFQALQILGVSSRFVRYPRESHGLSRSGEPRHLVHRLNEIKTWFVKYLKDDVTISEVEIKK